MFNLKHLKLIKELKGKSNTDWLKYASSDKKSELLDEIIADNKFVQEEMQLRAMVEDMLQKEFSPDIKNIKNYDFLVDSVIDKLKSKQLGNISESEDIE